jgi:photosystem II stability/assembly factor-like uncharacterized protein
MRVGLGVVLGIALVLAYSVSPVASSPSASNGTPVGDRPYFHYFGQNLVLVGAYTGLYRATNTGWHKIYGDFHNVRVTPDEKNIYLYNPDLHIYYSGDAGETWTQIGTTPVFTESPGYGDSFYPTPMPDIFFLGADNTQPFEPGAQGIYKSADRGAMWKQVLAGNNWDVAISPNFAQDGIAFASLREYHLAGPVMKTADWGETWTVSGIGLYTGFSQDGYNIAISPQFAQDQTVFVACGLGLYKSTDRGETWAAIFSPYDVSRLPRSVALSPYYLYDQTLVYWSEYSDLRLSQDGGRTWKRGVGIADYPLAAGIRYPGPFGPRPAPPAPGPFRVYLPEVSNRSTALELWYVGQQDYLGADPYLYRSVDYGATWQQVDVFEVSHWLYLPVVSRGVIGN